MRSQAVRFAKRAVAKGSQAPAGLNWRDCEGRHRRKRAALLIIRGTIADRARAQGLTAFTFHSPDEAHGYCHRYRRYLSDAELEHLRKFNRKYRLSVITESLR